MLSLGRLFCATLALILLFPVDLYAGEARSTDVLNTQPLSSSACKNPGNVFLLGELVHVAIPSEQVSNATTWSATDERGNVVAKGKVIHQETRADNTAARERRISLGKLGVGWYRVKWQNVDNDTLGWTTAAVLSPLIASPPKNSPVCVDAAISWFARDDLERQTDFSQLATLAGVSWIRDRLRWRDLQPTPDKYVSESTLDTTYDSAAKLQAEANLNVLQVFHDTPPWAVGPDGRRGRFPDDLRHVHHFSQVMARRFAGKVKAWEPWNEANVADFGAHTIDEICSYQKAAYLGFKSGNAKGTVCWNATTGVPTDRQTAGVLKNETWPYYDTFNIHTYDWPTSYQRLWGPVREAAVGKPIWVTESNRGMKTVDAATDADLAARNEWLKAEFIAQSFALSFQAGSERHFHFILGQYGERDIQFGLLRQDLTPRPAYVALANVGRMLAGARCLGQYVVKEQPNAFVVAFSAFPNGKRRDVLIAWAERPGDWDQRGKMRINWPLPDSLQIEACFDYLGRPISKVPPQKLTSAPVFLVLPEGEANRLALKKPERSTPLEASSRDINPSPVVMQCVWPYKSNGRDKSIPWAWEFEHQLKADTEQELPLFVYNFDDKEVTGMITLENVPPNYHISPSRWQVNLAPNERLQLPAKVNVGVREEAKPKAEDWLVLRGDFGKAGQPVLAIQLFAKSK